MVHLLILYLDSVQIGTTALYVASQNGHVRAVQLLIAEKAKVDIQQKVRFNVCLPKIIWMCTEWSHSIVHCQ